MTAPLIFFGVLSAFTAVVYFHLNSQRTLRRTIRSLEQTAKGNLSAIQQLIAEITASARQFSVSADELSSMGRQMIAGTETTSSQANMVSEASDQVSHSVQTVAAAAEEMTSSIGEIAKNAADAAKVANSAVGLSASTSATISKLSDASQQIGKIIKVITSIAEQTNLLALNATIEAARAGEAGKGFAVVANEVKELAKETAKATEDVGRQISAIQTETNNSVDAISHISRIVRQINDFQTAIAGAVEEQTATTREIGRSVTQAATGTSDIAQAMDSVAKAANDASKAALNSQQLASRFTEIAAQMQIGLDRYQGQQHGV